MKVPRKTIDDHWMKANGEGRIVVAINGAIHETQPLEGALLRIVVFGSKANDIITVDPSVTVPATLDGGHGGRNRLRAGGGPTTLHGWFGANVLAGGPEMDSLIGRAGRAGAHRRHQLRLGSAAAGQAGVGKRRRRRRFRQ